jgi:ketosteroid isomerase-like protein
VKHATLEHMPHDPTTAALESRAAWIDAELLRLEGVSAVKRLQRALGYYIDQAAWDEAADLFAEDGTLEVALDGVYRGRDRIRQYLYALGGGRRGLGEGVIHECMQLQPLVTIAPDGETAHARWRAFLMAGRYRQGAFWGEGPLEVRYVRQADVWRIASLHAYQTFIVPYEGGWVRHADATGGKLASERLPPDAPPTERYETWPGVYTPPYHFESPVEGLHPPPPFPPTDDDPALAPSIQALERRLLLLHDVAQIENLVSAYGYYLDKQQWDALAGLFAEDATMEVSQRGVYVGRASIRRALELFGPQGLEHGHLHNHIQLQPVIHVAGDGKRAWVRSRALSQLGVYEKAGLWGGGLYENELVKQDGLWRFQRDHVYTTFFAHYEQGWMSGARPTPKASEQIPPDGPPTEAYESFPEVYIPAFHYRHPVTGQPVRLASPLGGPPPAAAPQAFPHEAAAPDLPAELRTLAGPLARLAARVQRLEDERAIENLQRSYGYFVDKALWREAADLFTDDGTLEIGGRGVFVGKARVLEYLRWLEPKGLARGKLFEHLQLQPVVSVAPDGLTAKGRWRFFAQVGEHQRSAIWGMGTYENEYVKEHGVWKLRRLHSYFRMYTPYADGWGRTALPNTRPEQTLPPDRPPTVAHEQYPATFIPACHYPHPARGR